MNRCAFIPLALVPLLAACATTGNIKGDFQCAAPGGTCAPMSSIDAAAIASIGNGRAPATGISDPLQGPRGLAGPLLTSATTGDGSAPPRTNDRVLRVVFPAHIDADGIYREESAAHAVVENAAWAEALGARPVPARGAPALRTSGIAVEPAPRSALATLDEIVADRAARQGTPAGRAGVQFAPSSPTASAEPIAFRQPMRSEPVTAFAAFASRSTAPLSLAEAAAGLSAPALPALDPRSPSANYDTRDVVQARTPTGAPVKIAPRVVQAASAVTKGKPVSPVAQSSAPAIVASATAPYGTHPVRWKGRTYQVPNKTPQTTVSAAEPAQPNPTAELNRASMAKTTAALTAPLAGAFVVASSPTTDARLAMARVRAMAAPVIANGVDMGREAAATAAPGGFNLPLASIASAPK